MNRRPAMPRKSLSRLIASLSLSLAAPVFAQPALAVDLLSDTFSVAVPPGEAVYQDLACANEQLISGGYAIDTVSESSLGDVNVIASIRHPDASGIWRVGLYNRGKATVTAGLRISILCD